MAPRHAAKPPRRLHVTALVASVVVVLAAAAATVTVLVPTATPTAGAAVHGPLKVAAITPNGKWISPDAQLRVLFNNPLSPATPTPTISPAVPGAWVHLSASVLSFRPVAQWKAGRHYLVTVPASTRSASGT